MPLSSNSIIHFTSSFTKLNSILANNFNIRYCREVIHTEDNYLDIIVPMVSFCDIPFSQILSHINNYGNYGIGLKKSWAEKNGLNPVLYLDQNSSLSNHFIELLTTIKGGPEKISISKLSKEKKLAFDCFRYLKNYQSDLKRVGKKTIKNYRFSDEREWRYVLNPSLEYPIFANMKEIDEQKIKEHKENYSKKIENEKLTFTPDDINYVIIKKESERNSIINKIEKTKSKFSMEQVKRLTSRIISVEQLTTDF